MTVDVAELGFETKTDGLKKGQDALRKTSEEAKKTEKASGGVTTKFKELSQSGGVFGKTLGKVRSIFASFTTGIGAFFSAAATAFSFGLMIEGARDMSSAVAELSTLLPTGSKELEIMQKAARSMGDEFGTNTTFQLKSFYSAVSAGASDAASAIAIVETANKLAIGGITDVTTGVDILTTAVNAYAASGLTAAEASDALFVGMKAGKTTIGELSSSLGKVIPIANGLGVSFDELVSGTAALTLQGITTAEATTGLRAILSGIAKPTTEAGKLAKQLGIDFSTTALRAKGLAGFLQEITDKTGGSADAISILFGSMEAFNSVLALSGAGGDKFVEILESMKNKAGQTDEAMSKVTGSLDFRWRKLLTKMGNLAVDFGYVMLSIIVPVGEAIVKLIDNFAAFLPILGKIGTFLGIAFSPIILSSIVSITSATVTLSYALSVTLVKAAFAAGKALVALALSNPFTAIALAITTAAAALYTFSENVRSAVNGFLGFPKQVNDTTSATNSFNGAIAENERKLVDAANATKAYRLELVDLINTQRLQAGAAAEVAGIELDAQIEKLNKLQQIRTNTYTGPATYDNILEKQLDKQISDVGKQVDVLREKYTPLVETGKVLTEQWQKAEELANKKPFEKIAAGAGAATKAIGGSAKEVKKVKDEIKKYYEGLKKIIDDGVSKFVDEMLGGFKNGMKGIWNIFKDTIKQLIVYAIKNPIPVTAGVTTTGTGAAASILGGGTGGGGLGILGGIGQSINTVVSGIATGFKGVMSNLFSGGFGGAASYIGTSLGTATSGLAGLAQAAGALLGPIAAVAAIFSFFKTKTKLLDAGLRVTVKDLDVLVQTFRTVKKTKFWGLSSKTKTSLGDADPGITAAIMDMYEATKKSVFDMAESIGLAGSLLEDFAGVINISTKGLATEQEISAAIQEGFVDLGNQMAETYDVLKDYAQYGETALETLTRLSSSLLSVNSAFQALGYSLFDVSLAGAKAASGVVDFFGSLDAFNQSTTYYFENFYTQAEQMKFASDQLKASLLEIGLSSETASLAMGNLRSVVDQYAAEGQYDIVAKLIQLAPLYVKAKELEASAINKTTGALSRYLNLQNIFATRQEAIFAETSAGYTTSQQDINSSNEEIKDLLREVVTAIREGDLNNARLTAKLVSIQSRVDLEPPV